MQHHTSSSTFDHLVKMLIIGDSGVGKSCLLLRYSEDVFTSSYITTIGIDFKVRHIELDQKRLKLQIWDTAGQERFRTITSAYYRGAMAIMVVYDVTNEESFQNVAQWLKNIEANTTSPDLSLLLVGNKCDMETKRVVDKARGQKLADDFGIPFMETSAKINKDVDCAFTSLARQVKVRVFDKLPPIPIVYEPTPKSEKKKHPRRCCG